MTHIFRHPKYYKELRKQYRDSIEALPRNGESLVPSAKPQASSDGELRAKAYAKLASRIVGKPQAPSIKRQADIKNHE